MKYLKHLIIAFVFTLTITNSKAQNYSTLKYWGKDIKLDRSFFEILNANYKQFMTEKAPVSRYYDYKDYNDIYGKIVESLRNPSFIMVVNEANELSWENSEKVLPGTSDEKGRSKKSTSRAGWIFHYVILPSLQQFSKGKI